MQQLIPELSLSKGGVLQMRIKRKSYITPVQILAIVFFAMTVLFALIPSIFTQYDPLENNLPEKLQGISARHLLGTDEYGRDILSRIIYGTGPSLLVGLGTALISMIIGVPLGLTAGYYGGIIDTIIMRIMDAFQSFPSILLAILMMTIFDPSVESLIITISMVSYPRFTRLVRGCVLSLKKMEYVESAKASGANDGYIMFRSILPNCLGNIIAQFTLLMSTAILIEAGLSFLGFGIQPPEPAWGSMLSYAKKYVAQSLSYIAGPTIMIFCIVMSINTLGDMLKKQLDPQKRG